MAAPMRRLATLNFLKKLKHIRIPREDRGFSSTTQTRFSPEATQDYEEVTEDFEFHEETEASGDTFTYYNRLGYGSAHYNQLYDGHVPSTAVQKGLLTVFSAVAALTNPWRDDMVAICGEASGQLALPQIRKKMLADPEGRQILQERPRISSQTIDLDYLKSLPEETFGRQYISFLETNNVTPDTRLAVRFVDDTDLAYVMQRYREVHDLMHTVLGMPTNMQGEVAVKWVEALQTGLPMCALGALFGPLRFGPKQRQRYRETYLSWALRNGANAKFLMNIYYEKRWEQPLDEMRQELNIEPPPVIKPKKR